MSDNNKGDVTRQQLVDKLVEINKELADWAVNASGTEEYLGTEELYYVLVTKAIGATADAIEEHCQNLGMHFKASDDTSGNMLSQDFFAQVNT